MGSAYEVFACDLPFRRLGALVFVSVWCLTGCLLCSNAPVLAATFCVESAAEFQEALSTAAQNHSDDTIKITTSVTDLGDFQLTPETGFSLKIIDGWNAGCTTRLNSKARPASTVLKNLPAEYFEPHCSTTGPKPPATAK